MAYSIWVQLYAISYQPYANYAGLALRFFEYPAVHYGIFHDCDYFSSVCCVPWCACLGGGLCSDTGGDRKEIVSSFCVRAKNVSRRGRQERGPVGFLYFSQLDRLPENHALLRKDLPVH